MRDEAAAHEAVVALVEAAQRKAQTTPLEPAPMPQEPEPLPPELEPVQAFPVEALPDRFRPWVEDVVEKMQCPADFVAVPMLVAAASLVARRVRIRPQARTDWSETGNLWGLIVGRPGAMKSPAMSRAMAPVNRLEARAATDFNEAMAAFEANALAAKLKGEAALSNARALLKKDPSGDISALLRRQDETPAPTRKRYLVNDLTYESLGEILAANPDGVLGGRDEMRGLLLTLAREENAAARAFYLQAWSGGRYTFDRITRGNVTIDDVRLSLVGCIQPGPLSDLVRQARRGAADDGMLERFLIAWPDVSNEWREVDTPPNAAAQELAFGVFERLDRLTAEDMRAEPDGNRTPYLRFADDAREAFSEWRHELERKLRTELVGEGLEGALSKFRHHVPALALTLHVVDGGIGPVNIASTLKALELADYFESHARRLHGSGRRSTIQACRAILHRSKSWDLPDPFTARDIYRRGWSGLTDATTVADALEMLTAHRWLTDATIPAGIVGGRPMTVYSLTQGVERG